MSSNKTPLTGKQGYENPLVVDLENIFTEVGEFSVKAFPGATSFEHILKLRQEALEVLKNPSDRIEYIDCLLALFAAMYKVGISYKKVIELSKAKLEVNKNREWVKQPDGTYQHK